MRRLVSLLLSLNVIPELPQRSPELHHVLGDGVEVLESALDVTRAFVQIQGIVQDNLVTTITSKHTVL